MEIVYADARQDKPTRMLFARGGMHQKVYSLTAVVAEGRGGGGFLTRGPAWDIVMGRRVPALRDADATAYWKLEGTRVYTLSGEIESYFYDKDVVDADPVAALILAAMSSGKEIGLLERQPHDPRTRTILDLISEARRRRELWQRPLGPAR